MSQWERVAFHHVRARGCEQRGRQTAGYLTRGGKYVIRFDEEHVMSIYKHFVQQTGLSIPGARELVAAWMISRVLVKDAG